MSVPTRRIIDLHGNEIFSGNKKSVEPVLWSTGSGESLLTIGNEGHGLTSFQGHAWYGGVHLAGDIITLTIPLNMKLKDIKSVGWLEKTKTNQVHNNTLQVIFQIDFDDNGVYMETSDDRFIFNSWQYSYGHPSWTKVNGIANVNMHGEALDTFKLYDGAWAAKATVDGAIASGEEASFAAFQATGLGEHYVKAMQIVYSGEKTGTADFWVMATNFAINGIFYELRPKHFSGAVYVNSDAADSAAARRFETSPKKLRDVIIKVTNKDAKFGDSANQTYRIVKDTGFGITQLDISTLYWKNSVGGENATVEILAVEE